MIAGVYKSRAGNGLVDATFKLSFSFLGKSFLYLCYATLHGMCGVVFFLSLLKPVSMNDVMYVSKDAFEKMRQELQRMKSVDRPAASRAIAEAREKGDLKENAEYDAAKEAQGMLEAKIALLESQIASSRIVDESEIDTSKVSILTRVTITNMATKKTVTYQIVGEKEADLKENKISISSPIGQGLLGKQKGEVAEVRAPTGIIKFKVDEITL